MDIGPTHLLNRYGTVDEQISRLMSINQIWQDQRLTELEVANAKFPDDFNKTNIDNFHDLIKIYHQACERYRRDPDELLAVVEDWNIYLDEISTESDPELSEEIQKSNDEALAARVREIIRRMKKRVLDV